VAEVQVYLPVRLKLPLASVTAAVPRVEDAEAMPVVPTV